ncbi:hypothetical protein [Corynebacterium vitaeruminis]|uniref:hypothetical protein n=1 Tax=Corynebacterium vitaeruminis TaxID=38305 RepID=UPI0028A8692D|nr:hypothetical protein [Corynebacterium vitaeruminis]
MSLNSIRQGEGVARPYSPFANRSVRIPLAIEYLIIACGTILSALFAVYGQKYLKAEFKGDAQAIARIGLTPKSDRVGDEGSFAVIADFYKYLGLIDKPVIAGVLGTLLGSVVILIAVRKSGGIRINLFSIGLILLAFLLNGIFLGQFTKEIFISFLVLTLLAAPQRWWGETLICIAMFAVAVWFRKYWALILVIYLTVRMIPPSGVKLFGRKIHYSHPLLFLGLLVSASVLISLVIGLATGNAGDYFRTSVNQWRVGDGSTASLIPQYVRGNNLITGILNNLLSTLFIILPVPLLLLAKPYYIASFVVFAFLWSSLFVGYLKLRQGGSFIANRAFALMVAFLLIQGSFEPDFGSALRHVVPIIPLFIFIVACESKGDSNFAGGKDAKAVPNGAGLLEKLRIESSK